MIRDILPGFTAAWPNVVLRVLTAPSYTLSDRVQRGKVQMALVSRPRESRSDVEVATQAQVLARYGWPERRDQRPLSFLMTGSADRVNYNWQLSAQSV
ncbi:hypothetical protein EMIT0P218_80260 [Pseudomonas sp. IT-P218]